MSKTKHTPGPWKASDKGTIVTAVVTREINGKMRTYEQKIATTPAALDEDERIANARLIAAAPDLIEVLLGIKEHGLSWDDRYDDVIAKAKGANQ